LQYSFFMSNFLFLSVFKKGRQMQNRWILLMAFFWMYLSGWSQGFNIPEHGFVSWKPAPNWEDALLSGNGTIGTMVFGEPHDETIIVNHALNHMPLRVPLLPIDQASRMAEIRALLAERKYAEAAQIPVEQSLIEGYEEMHWIDPFVPLCNIRMVMEPGNISDYVRMVDFETGEAKVQWQQNGEMFQRSLFVSRADSVIVMCISGTAAINMELFLRQHPIAWDQSSYVNSAIKSATATATDDYLTYQTFFHHQYDGIPQGFESVARVITKGGTHQAVDGRLVIKNAEEVLVVMAVEPNYDESQSLIDNMKSDLASKGGDYEHLLSAQKVTHGELFNRVRLTLGDGAESDLQSEALVVRARQGSTPAIIQKQFDAARYNIISSTGTNPPTLQGIWSGTWTPPWSSGFTHDGNVEVAVSHLLSANTPELMKAYLDYHERMVPYYRVNAQRLFGTRGIHVPAHSSSHGYNIHYDKTWTLTLWSGGAGWTSSILYDYYLYTGDKALLKNRIYPFMKESAWFYEDFLIVGEDGKYLFSPSYSPENNPGNSPSQLVVNATMDVMIAKELLRNCIEAGKIVGETSAQIRKWEDMLAEYFEENHSHRHVSQLYSLFERIDPDFKENQLLIEAALKTVEARMEHRRRAGGGEMVFGLAQLGMVAANTEQAELTGEIIDLMSRYYWAPSLATYHNSGNLFNMDMSGGFPAVILRSLAYSEPGLVKLLPALSPDWESGAVEGMALRGQIVINRLSWTKTGIEVVLTSAIDQQIEMLAPSLQSFESSQKRSVSIVKGRRDALNVQLKAGEQQKISVGY
jgi:alpha-L-fucosidase 2